MKVYVVMHCDYSQTWARAVFSTREKADAFVSAEGNPNYDVDEFELDDESGLGGTP